MNRDFKDCLFYYDKLSVALNAITLGEFLWIYQENPEDILRFYAYLGSMPLVAWNMNWCGQSSQQALTLDDSSGLLMLGLR